MSLERLILIDGYNVIHRTPSLKPGKDRTLREAREKLLNLLAWAVGSGQAEFLVVFDGAEGTGHDQRQSRVESRFSRPPQKADDLIRELVEDRVERVEHLTVVTADIEVARHARAMGADIVLSDLFVASLLGPARDAAGEKPISLTRKEVEEWSEIFLRKRPAAGSRVNEDREEPGGAG